MMKNLMKPILILSCLAALSGCVGSTTYGTGKTQNQHLVEDLSTILKPRKSNSGNINYAGRTDLIKPEDVSQLPEPVQTRAVDNSNWVEAPEVRRARIRGEAEVMDPRGATVSAKELNRKKRGAKVAFGPGKQINGNTRASESAFIPLSVQEKQGKAYRKKQAVLAGVDAGSATAERKYLTEPKTEYRTPSDTAPIGDIGEDERVKAKRLKGERGFFDFLKRKK